MGLIEAGRAGWQPRAYQPGDCAGAWLVCACTDDPAVNAAVAAEAEQAGIWSVRADDAAASAAWTPAAGQAGDVRFGVVSGDPQRSAGIRDEVLAGLQAGRLAAAGRRRRGGRVALVGGGPGDPGLITVRGRQLLAEADVVVADRLAPGCTARRAGAGRRGQWTRRRSRAVRAWPRRRSTPCWSAGPRQGLAVVRLKGGDPFVFGRGAEEVLACLAAGVPVTVVPGVTSAIAVPAAAGIPVTHRGVSQEFHVVSAHLPPGDGRSTVDWPALAASAATLVLLMALENLEQVARTLIRHGRDSRTPVSVIVDGTLPTQHIITTGLGAVGSAVEQAPATARGCCDR